MEANALYALSYAYLATPYAVALVLGLLVPLLGVLCYSSFGAGMAVLFRYPESPHIRIHGQSAMRITTAFGIGCGTNSRSDAFIVSSAKLGHSAVFISIILRRSPSNRIAHWITTICSTAARRAISPNRLRS